MTLAELRYLVAVAELRHFGHAAERCHITQPTLSSQLRKLEESLGVQLVERTTRSVTLTPIGERIVTHARRILEESDQIAELARHRQGALTSVLRLGIIPTLSPYILPLFLNRLHQSFPLLRLVLREDLTDNLLSALETHALDVLLIALPDQAGVHPSMPLFREQFCFVCPTGHKLSNRPAVTEDDLAQERLLLLEEGHCLREQALTYPDHADARLGATSLATVLQMVASGYGVTLLPEVAIDVELRDKRVKLLRLAKARNHEIVMCSRVGRMRSIKR